MSPGFSVLDVGVGEGWFYEFLENKGLVFRRVVGVDVDERVKRREGLDYVFTRHYSGDERFDLVVCLDALHLVSYDVAGFARAGGFVLVSVPERFGSELVRLNNTKTVIEGVAGRRERDRFVFAGKV